MMIIIYIIFMFRYFLLSGILLFSVGVGASEVNNRIEEIVNLDLRSNNSKDEKSIKKAEKEAKKEAKRKAKEEAEKAKAEEARRKAIEEDAIEEDIVLKNLETIEKYNKEKNKASPDVAFEPVIGPVPDLKQDNTTIEGNEEQYIFDNKKIASEKNNIIGTVNLSAKNNEIPLNLYNLIYIALQRNNSTREAFINIKIAERQLGKQKSVYYPTVSASAGYSRNDGDSYNTPQEAFNASLDLNYEIFTFGKNSASVKAMESYLSSVKYERDNLVQNVIFEVINSYYSLLSLEAQKTAALESEILSQEAYKAASLKYKIGLVPLIDKLQSKTSYVESKSKRVEIENNIKKQKASLNNLLNLEPNYTIYVDEPDIKIKGITKSIDYYLKKARENRFDLKSLVASKEQALAELKAAKAERYPTINLQGSIGDRKDLSDDRVSSDHFVDNNISIGVSVPLFTGFSTYNNIKVYEQNIEKLNIQIEQKERDISKEVWDAYQDFNTNQVSYFLAKETLETAKESARLTLGMYKNGKASILDVLTSQDSLESSKYNFINATYNWLVYRMKLLKVIGKMNLENIINIDTL